MNSQEINILIGDIRSESEEGNWYDALDFASELPEHIREGVINGICHQHGIQKCPCCDGRGGWEGMTVIGPEFADCPFCDGYGWADREGMERWEREQEEEARMRADNSWRGTDDEVAYF